MFHLVGYTMRISFSVYYCSEYLYLIKLFYVLWMVLPATVWQLTTFNMRVIA